jgi:uncharacterized membrane protein YphA (DoxX/SURF4 family)
MRSCNLVTSPYRLSTCAIILLVALRLGIGWHFFQEGADKLRSGKFSSVGFLSSAKGPLAPFFRSLIWDADGLARLDKEQTLEAWAHFRQRLTDHYGFDESQDKRAGAVLANRSSQLEWFFHTNADEIKEYLLGLERRDRNRRDAARREVASLRGQAAQLEMELTKKRGPWLANLDKLWGGLEADLNGIASAEQSRRGWFSLAKPARGAIDSLRIDAVIPYFDLLIGIGLILGLFTRIASVAGAGFLASVIATQWPGAEGSLPVYYQTVEMLSLLVLAAVGAGRFAGLDFFLGCLRQCCCPPKQERKS